MLNPNCATVSVCGPSTMRVPAYQRRRDKFADYLETYLLEHPERFNYRVSFQCDNLPGLSDIPFSTLADPTNPYGTAGCIASHYAAVFHPTVYYSWLGVDRSDLYEYLESSAEKHFLSFHNVVKCMGYETGIARDIIHAITKPPYYDEMPKLPQDLLRELLSPIIRFLRTNDASGLVGDWTDPIRTKANEYWKRIVREG